MPWLAACATCPAALGVGVLAELLAAHVLDLLVGEGSVGGLAELLAAYVLDLLVGEGTQIEGVIVAATSVASR